MAAALEVTHLFTQVRLRPRNGFHGFPSRHEIRSGIGGARLAVRLQGALSLSSDLLHSRE